MLLFIKKLGKILSSIDKYILDNAIKKNADKCAVKTIKTHERKLRNLTKNVTLPFRDTKTVHKCMLLKNIEIWKIGQQQRYCYFTSR